MEDYIHIYNNNNNIIIYDYIHIYNNYYNIYYILYIVYIQYIYYIYSSCMLIILSLYIGDEYIIIACSICNYYVYTYIYTYNGKGI